MLENKYLRWHYVVTASIFTILVTGFLVFKGQASGIYPEETLELIKSFAYVLTFVGVPAAYGWFKGFGKVTKEEEKLTKEQEQKKWVVRFLVFSTLAIFNSALYISTFDRSLMFLLIISLLVFLLNKPRPIITEDNHE